MNGTIIVGLYILSLGNTTLSVHTTLSVQSSFSYPVCECNTSYIQAVIMFKKIDTCCEGFVNWVSGYIIHPINLLNMYSLPHRTNSVPICC